jgi:hypothetical protein
VLDSTLPSSLLQTTATLSRTYSLAWIGAFVTFIDDTFKELTAAKFSSARGWSLITRLASRILFEVSGPRNGVKQTFTTGKNELIAKQIFWAVLRSHDVMANFKDKSFKNDASVSAEYVKFLIMNTGMEVVDQLGKRVQALEEKMLSMAKEVRTAEAKSSAASNGVTGVSKSLELLTKRVAALESRK